MNIRKILFGIVILGLLSLLSKYTTGLSHLNDMSAIMVDKTWYIGQWSGDGVTLLITHSWMINYERVSGSSEVTMSEIPIQRFSWFSFYAWIWKLRTFFDVSVPPTITGDKVFMVVDSRTLYKVK